MNIGDVCQPAPLNCFDKVGTELNKFAEDQPLTSNHVACAYCTKVSEESKVKSQLTDPEYEVIKCGSKVPVNISMLPKPTGIYALDEWDDEDINRRTTFDDFTNLKSSGNPIGNTFP